MFVDVAVLGAGAWGTALATVLARSQARVWLHAYRADHARALERERENRRLLPGVALLPAVAVTNDYQTALADAATVLLVVPTQTLRQTLEHARPSLRPDAVLVSACKGIETQSGRLVHQIVADVLGPDALERTVHLSGPSFAGEVARQTPTNLVAASRDSRLAEAVQALVATEWLRVYTSDDPIGVEVGGALKNVIAIAAGACVGLGLGYNAQAALVTRGLAEMTRLTLALGGQAQTLAGLSGLGDLILSCTFAGSRNRELGVQVGRGVPLAEAFAALGGVAEGYSTAKAVQAIASESGVDLPICDEVYQVLHRGKPVRAAVSDLMARPLKKEWT
ncbi:MAG TPA: NAD(P)H-dependent glycerol-3-phosphate dehydrogenase [Polyangiaceae bacterium]